MDIPTGRISVSKADLIRCDQKLKRGSPAAIYVSLRRPLRTPRERLDDTVRLAHHLSRRIHSRQFSATTEKTGWNGHRQSPYISQRIPLLRLTDSSYDNLRFVEGIATSSDKLIAATIWHWGVDVQWTDPADGHSRYQARTASRLDAVRSRLDAGSCFAVPRLSRQARTASESSICC